MAFAWMPACCEVFGNLRGIFFRFLNVDFRFLVHFSLFKCKIKSFRSVKGHLVSSKCAQRATLFLFVSIPLVFYLFWLRSAFTSLPPGQQGGGRRWIGAGVMFDATVVAGLLSVVDLPDLSTVNRQGWVKVSSGQQWVRHPHTWPNTHTETHKLV